MQVGIDIVQISRLQKMKNFDSFLNKYFTSQEIEYSKSKNNIHQTVAGLFATKEAFLKALKIGIGNGLELKDIEIMHDNNNAPTICQSNKVQEYLQKANCFQISISISHDGDYAIAIALIG